MDSRTDKKDFLLELGCEELPASGLTNLAKHIEQGLLQQLQKADLHLDSSHHYATPRRLAIVVKGLDSKQPNRVLERHGPYVKDAYDKSGTPTLACLGFARSCNVSVDQLQQQQTEKGERVYVKAEQPGLPTNDLLAEIIETVFKKLPLSKPMRWGATEYKFIRPVHWIVVMFGRDLIHCNLFGCQSTLETRGHRFHHPLALQIQSPQDYAAALYSPGHVIADFEKRKQHIRKHIEQTASPHKAIIDESLLDEVTCLVEWPVVLKGNFDKTFLALPKEVLITSMQTHQKCFAIENNHGDLLPHFILVSNIESKDPQVVIQGNQKVISARLSDAQFFYQNDCKHPLAERMKSLEKVLFQKKLGTIAEKSKRIEKLANSIAPESKRAALLCKCDLATDMVYEFPGLQGVMGYYYAKKSGESDECATAIKEHYLPRFSGDKLPETEQGSALALADRIDTLVGIIGIKLFPKADKDPFALRRAALGIIRILIEQNIDQPLKKLLKSAAKYYGDRLTNKDVVDNAFDFVLERLKYWYVDKGVPIEVYESVLQCCDDNLVDFNQRVQAVLAFQQLPEAEALAAANKRVNNILKKQNKLEIPKKINDKLFESDTEQQLATFLSEKSVKVKPLLDQSNYKEVLSELSQLKDPVDTFFDDVMIMAEDKKLRANRLALLSELRRLFTQVADISLLP
ncbi:MAG: glycine--tRNA ligase subunit beta [Gammaproteobacteria bacterium]|nr:glycine--tRNA ligase subunit beta [Gammaproteobacteria bacterium]